MSKFLLSTSGIGLAPGAQANELWEKDCIRDGRWYVPSAGVHLHVTPERRAKWAENFKLMRERGVSVPLTVDHLDANKAEAKRGGVVELFNEGERLKFRAKPADADSAILMGRCPEVSIEIDRDWKDGHGNVYDEAITAITLTPKPVIPGQEAWKRIAASRAGTTDEKNEPMLANPECTDHSPSTAHGEQTMFKPEQLPELRTLLSLKADAPEAEIATALLTAVKTGKEAGAKLTETTTKLSRVEGELTTATSRIASLESGKAPTIDEDALEAQAENVKLKLSRLLDACKLTPAALKVAEAKLIGEAGKRPTLCLSRKAAVHAGMSAPVADAVLEILEANDAAELAKLQGEKSKQQTLQLSRETPGDDSKPDADAVKRMEEKAFGK